MEVAVLGRLVAEALAPDHQVGRAEEGEDQRQEVEDVAEVYDPPGYGGEVGQRAQGLKQCRQPVGKGHGHLVHAHQHEQGADADPQEEGHDLVSRQAGGEETDRHEGGRQQKAPQVLGYDGTLVQIAGYLEGYGDAHRGENRRAHEDEPGHKLGQ